MVTYKEKMARRNDPSRRHNWLPLNDDVSEFMKRVQKLDSGCRVILGCRIDAPQKSFIWEGILRTAAHIYYIINNGKVEDWERVLPTCGHKGCINPNHMAIVDYQEVRKFYGQLRAQRNAGRINVDRNLPKWVTDQEKQSNQRDFGKEQL